jgi:hypothetical protein
MEFRVTSETRDAVLSELQQSAIHASPRRTDVVTFNITTGGLDNHLDVIKTALQRAEELSR